MAVNILILITGILKSKGNDFMKKISGVFAVVLALLVAFQSTALVFAASTVSKYTGKTYSHNSQFDSYVIQNGVDVSEWQANVDWTKVKGDGIDFAVIRAGYGKDPGQTDKYFEQNYKNAKAVGMPIGTYWYSYATTIENVKKEAARCIETLKGKSFELPVYFDLEESSQFNKGVEFCSQAVETFCEAIRAAGYTPGLYMSRYALMNYIKPEVRNKYELWVAEYGTSSCKYTGEYAMWQYADTGKVNGINGNADVNFRYTKDYTRLADQAYTGKAITPQPQIKVGSKVLVNNTDYQLFYENNTAVGEAVITAKGIGDYLGYSWYFKFNIVPAKVTGLTLESRTKTSLTYVWNKAGGAKQYKVYVLNDTTGKSFTKTVSDTKVTLSGLTDTNYYKVKVCAVNGSYVGAYSSINAKHTLPGQVTGLTTYSYGTTSLILKWNRKAGATGYYIYQYYPSSKTTKQIATVKGDKTTTYKITNKASGTYYYYYVAAYTVDSKTKVGAKSSKLTTSTRPKATKLTSATSPSYKRLTVKWNKVTCTGYAVQYSTKKDFSSDVKTIYVGGSKSSVTIKTNKSNRTYYVRVRPYKYPNNTRLYGSYSSAKSVKVK